MYRVILILLIILFNVPGIASACVALYSQCGGLTYNGSKECCSPATCQYNNDYYSQCLTGTTATTKATSTVSSSSTTRASTECNALYSQCGGQNWPGSICCKNSICVKINDYYSQCLESTSSSTQPTTVSSSTTKASSSTTKASSSTTQPSSPSTTKASSGTTQAPSSAAKASSSTAQSSSSTTKASTSTTKGSTSCSDAYGQCGGTGWTGPTCCISGSTCQYNNPYYSQCIPTSVSSTSSSSTTKASTSSGSTTQPSTTAGTNDGRVNGVTTRYWDCCKASCGWSGKASVTSPVKTCAKDGITAVDVNIQSGCNGGTGYMCNNQQPWNVSSTLSYGYAAAYIAGQGESNWCCACYSLIFTTGPVVGKELIVQVTNTGGDLGNNHFDLQMPGGGVGIFDGCSSQWTDKSYAWGQRYGGVSNRSDCNSLPTALQKGCYWRFDWFMNADNPQMRFKQVACPAVLTNNTQCIRL